MKLNTPASLHADHQLDQLAAQFEHWRQSRTHPRERIPQALWDQAAALATLLPYTRVAKQLRLSPTDLQTHMAAEPTPHVEMGPTTPGFVEVPRPAPPEAPGGLEVELLRPDGVRLRIHSPDASLPLAAIVQRVLEA